MLQPLVINIPFDPNIGTFGPFQITWHGVFTAVAIAVAVMLIAYFARKHNLLEDDIYNIALWGVPAGIVGARLLFVIEHLSTFQHDWGSVFSVNEGGISIYGGLIGGAGVAFAYAWRKKLYIRRISDAAALGLAVSLAVGRMGDLVNGEHWARASNLPWAFCYTNPNTLNGDPNTSTTAVCGSITRHPLNPPAVHPVAGLYEPVILIGIFFFLWYLYRRLNVAGYIFWVFVLLYAVMRFALAPLRLNETKWGSISVPQVTAAITVVVAIIALFIVRRMAQRNPENATAVAPIRETASPLSGPSGRRTRPSVPR
ncbi:MAG: prolipoprotein diacylglyceryl transferase [Dehalococcoidia bacterium]